MTKQDEEFQEFKQKLLDETKLTKEVFELCFQLAWDDSHAYGYHEVESRFNDLEDLFHLAWNSGYDLGYNFGYNIGYCDGEDGAND
jgi:hypothetical protein